MPEIRRYTHTCGAEGCGAQLNATQPASDFGWDCRFTETGVIDRCPIHKLPTCYEDVIRAELIQGRETIEGLHRTLKIAAERMEAAEREAFELRSGCEPDPEWHSHRRFFRCAATGCDAELRTCAEYADFGWDFTWDKESGERFWCIVHRQAEPDTIDSLRKECAELRRKVEEERGYAVAYGGDSAQLHEMVLPALRDVLGKYEADDSDRAGEDLYEAVQMIESGDWFSNEDVPT